MPVGDHTIELRYTRKPPGQPQAFEEGSAKWDVRLYNSLQFQYRFGDHWPHTKLVALLGPIAIYGLES